MWIVEENINEDIKGIDIFYIKNEKDEIVLEIANDKRLAYNLVREHNKEIINMFNEELDEKWKKIEELENYEISNFGRVRNIKTGRILKNQIKDGREVLNLSKKKIFIHRLVADAFIPNPNNFPQVNHKDENPLNNHFINLEWCTSKYNSNYGLHNERVSRSNKGNKKSNNTNYLDNKNRAKKVICDGVIYESIKDCAEKYGINKGTMQKWLQGIHKIPEDFQELGLRYYE